MKLLAVAIGVVAAALFFTPLDPIEGRMLVLGKIIVDANGVALQRDTTYGLTLPLPADAISDEAQERIGEGPSLFLHDTSMLPNLRLRDFVLETARDLGIPVQFNVLSGYGQDGAVMQRAGGGAPAINIAVPPRYLHSHNGVISRTGVEATIHLVTEVVRRLDAEAIAGLRDFS